MSNVVIFPKGKFQTPPQSMEELISSVEETRREHVDHVVDEITSIIFNVCAHEGFDLHQDDKIESTIFMVEAIKAALLDSVNIEHPLLDLAYDMVSSEDIAGE